MAEARPDGLSANARYQYEPNATERIVACTQGEAMMRACRRPPWGEARRYFAGLSSLARRLYERAMGLVACHCHGCNCYSLRARIDIDRDGNTTCECGGTGLALPGES